MNAAPEQAVSLLFGIPDHPWVDASDGAAVRIAMTVAAAGQRRQGVRQNSINESDNGGESLDVVLESRSGLIRADLKIGADVPGAKPLRANSTIAGMGVALHGAGFILEPERVDAIREYGAAVVKGYVAGRDLLQVPRTRWLIDFTGLSESDALAANPAAFQHVINYVKPERDENRREVLKRLWWRFGWERPVLRKALIGLRRYIGTTETSKHRPFQFINGDVLSDHTILSIACDDELVLGVLSSHVHVRWALAAGGTLEDRPRYNKVRCFDPFPFPVIDDGALRARIRTLAEHLDAHRKRQQAAHADLTLTGIYNVLEKLKSGEALNAKDKLIHEHGLVSVLKQLHDELDLAVLDAYGWSDLAPLMQCVNGNAPHPNGASRDDAIRELDEALLERLVALNAERAAEESRGLIRWLRPDFQNPSAHSAPDQSEIDTGDDDSESPVATVATATTRTQWPKDLTDQVRAIADTLTSAPAPLSEADLAERFTGRGRWRERLPRILDMLVALGNVKQADGRYRRA